MGTPGSRGLGRSAFSIPAKPSSLWPRNMFQSKFACADVLLGSSKCGRSLRYCRFPLPFGEEHLPLRHVGPRIVRLKGQGRVRRVFSARAVSAAGSSLHRLPTRSFKANDRLNYIADLFIGSIASARSLSSTRHHY